MALSEACHEAIHLLNLELEIIGYSYKIILYNGSLSALKLANNHQSHRRSKHIYVRYNFYREIINKDIVETMSSPSTKYPL